MGLRRGGKEGEGVAGGSRRLGVTMYEAFRKRFGRSRDTDA